MTIKSDPSFEKLITQISNDKSMQDYHIRVFYKTYGRKGVKMILDERYAGGLKMWDKDLEKEIVVALNKLLNHDLLNKTGIIFGIISVVFSIFFGIQSCRKDDKLKKCENQKDSLVRLLVPITPSSPGNKSVSVTHDKSN